MEKSNNSGPDPTPYWHDFLAGYVGGVCGVVIGHPFDTVKIRLQTRGHLYKTGVDAFRKAITNSDDVSFRTG